MFYSLSKWFKNWISCATVASETHRWFFCFSRIFSVASMETLLLSLKDTFFTCNQKHIFKQSHSLLSVWISWNIWSYQPLVITWDTNFTVDNWDVVYPKLMYVWSLLDSYIDSDRYRSNLLVWITGCSLK